MDEKPSQKGQAGSSKDLGGPRGDDGAKAVNGGTGGTNPPIDDGGPPRGGGKHKHPHQA